MLRNHYGIASRVNQASLELELYRYLSHSFIGHNLMLYRTTSATFLS
ncbi:MAG: hypothetical protein CLLPBCKN_006864 [Chroococcidiopsis cubana SAG 39.79]|nr:hypothetical protein [Chroococcidiopsis cubana SAG 39.79]